MGLVVWEDAHLDLGVGHVSHIGWSAEESPGACSVKVLYLQRSAIMHESACGKYTTSQGSPALWATIAPLSQCASAVSVGDRFFC